MCLSIALTPEAYQFYYRLKSYCNVHLSKRQCQHLHLEDIIELQRNQTRSLRLSETIPVSFI